MVRRKYKFPVGFFDHFQVAMDRELPPFMVPTGMMPNEEKSVINLGAGSKDIAYAVPLDAPQWWAGTPMPYEDGEVDEILAYHFFEHLTKEELIATLRECERVLCDGGVINAVTPHWSAEIAHQDLDHKLFFSEQTWRNLFNNTYYDGTMPRDWKLGVGFQMICGLVQRNLALFSQIVKTND